MGLERIAAVVQGVHSNFDIDLFQSIIGAAAALAGVTYEVNDEHDTALRVIADHSRSVAFLIADGVLPSNEGRGYVLRRLIRRALRFGKLIGLSGPFLYKTADTVADVMEPKEIELAKSKNVNPNQIVCAIDAIVPIVNPANKLSAVTVAQLKELFMTHEGLRRAKQSTEAALAEVRAANSRITELYEKTVELDKLRTRFFANVSHELRTPLALILGPLANRLQASGQDDPGRGDLETIDRNARLLYRHGASGQADQRPLSQPAG